MTMTDIATTEQRIAERINSSVTGELSVSNAAGGLAFVNMNQAMEFAKMMAISSVAVPKHLRANPGACLAVVIQAIEWRLSPYAVANKSYSVNDRLAYESQLVQAVILQRAPIVGRFKVEYTGDGDNRVCKVWARLKDGEETVEYISPPFGKITPKNSPLWKSDPDQQQFYYSGRALCRRHFPDVLLGVYADDEILPAGPDGARDVTPSKSIADKLDQLAGLPSSASPSLSEHDPETGEVTEQTNSAASTAIGEKTGDAAEAGSATSPADPANNQASSQPTAKDPAETAAPGQAAPDSSNPPRSKDDGAATAAGKTTVPKNEAEYVAYADAWRIALTDADAGEARWKEEKALRNKAHVGSDARESLQEKLAAKCAEIRDADKS
jgi:hypothetical protein